MLTCMATYRCTDKKPCDNIPKEPNISQLADAAITNVFGGDMSRRAVNNIKQVKSVNGVADLLNNNTVKAAFDINRFASAVNKSAKAEAGFEMELFGSGKALCPSVR